MTVAVTDWNELARQWQGLATQWSRFWTQSADTPMAVSALEIGNAAIAPPVPPPAWIDPVAASELTERYGHKFEALWKRVLANGDAMPPEAMAPSPDRRFSAKEWREHTYFAWLKDAYLLYADYVRELAQLAQADAATKKRLAFLAEQYADAVAPSNFLATNPEALKKAIDTGGASLARGISNLVADVQRGRISMTDESAFRVGENLAITPGSVVLRNDLIELIQYAPTTKEVWSRPLLIVPPCINKYYILDLRPENSFIRFAIDEGHTVFMISWRNIPPGIGHMTWDDYIESGILNSMAAVQEITGSKTINALGFCVGGTMLASALAVLAARHEHSVSSATLLATMLDFAEPGDIGVYVSREALFSRAPMLLAGGRVHGSELASAFATLRPNDLVWNYVVGNYLKGQTPPPFDLLYWNSDSANLPGPMYVYYLSNMYIDNRLREPNALTMCGESIDLSRVTLPAYLLATHDDHIVPWRSAYRSTRLLGGDITFVLGASGHIAGVVNPAAKNRRNYWTKELLTDDADAWLARAESHAGSWWLHWTAWLARYAGTKRRAPRRQGNVRYRPICAAPGTYVVEKVA